MLITLALTHYLFLDCFFSSGWGIKIQTSNNFRDFLPEVYLCECDCLKFPEEMMKSLMCLCIIIETKLLLSHYVFLR